ncbi:MAG: STAS domain-containing protein [Rhodospirillales bacterium]|nr:STAS domain-containing protein [Rhodospirillales bacterium]
MKYSIREERGFNIVEFSGEIDLEHSPLARTVLLDIVGVGANILVDMSGVKYIDSSGVASLVEAFQSARSAGTEFAMVSVSDEALRVLHLARLDKIFTIYESIGDAFADE